MGFGYCFIKSNCISIFKQLQFYIFIPVQHKPQIRQLFPPLRAHPSLLRVFQEKSDWQ